MILPHATLLFAIVLVLELTTAHPAHAIDQLTPLLDQEVTRTARNIPNLAVRIVELGRRELDYAYRADAHMTPASNQKLLTTAAALSLLGPGYAFETQVGIRGDIGADGVLTGDLAVRGAGDPTISGRENGDPYAHFRRWAAALRGRGVRRVAGDLYLEHGLFNGPVVHPDWPPEQQQWWYEAPVAALSFNDNCQLLRGWGAARRGQRGILDLVPRVDALLLQNGLRTVRSNTRWAVLRNPGSRLVQVSGEMPASGGPMEVWVTVPDPIAYFGLALRAALAEEGIVVEGQTRPVERLPGPWWELVYTHRTLLVAALDVTNKRSQNFYAESLLKLLGARFCKDGSFWGGSRVVSDFLARKVGWPRDQFHVTDGSGMSRGDWVTAQGMTQLLEYMFRQRWGVEFVKSLPYAGEAEASLHQRLTEPAYRGNVFAKTGTIERVSTLSGYAKGRSGRIYAFSILANGANAWQG
ncbi:MAG TPA: D-alanyl-D-alanine carboxypeptidase/D-alanyl-D-alanine-endopeptidase, partial [Thermoanaerobaculia bacterium]|nr:D-alanyl-D-alanine carboxypeptidase/D-alanyl-D-alanine-endopeptidase [Thermoanaerobaculia bacterium]